MRLRPILVQLCLVYSDFIASCEKERERERERERGRGREREGERGREVK
jgi:hypothetical protein